MPAKANETAGSTRERILDVALELFTSQGYDGTSLRDIAERLGVTKAALYYHFERKEDIFLELHLRLHRLGEDTFEELVGLDAKGIAEAWPRLLDRFIELLIENRELFLLHERNRSAVEALQGNPRHQAENEDLEQKLREVLSHPDLTPRQRVRMAASIAAALGGLLGGTQVFEDIEPAQLAELVREAVSELSAGIATA